jgi:hypothetical protein
VTVVVKQLVVLAKLVVEGFEQANDASSVIRVLLVHLRNGLQYSLIAGVQPALVQCVHQPCGLPSNANAIVCVNRGKDARKKSRKQRHVLSLED